MDGALEQAETDAEGRGGSRKQRFCMSPLDAALVEKITAPLQAQVLDTLTRVLSVAQLETKPQPEVKPQLYQLAETLTQGCKSLAMQGARTNSMPGDAGFGSCYKQIEAMEDAIPSSLPFSKHDKSVVIRILISMVTELLECFLYTKKPSRDIAGNVITWEMLVEAKKNADAVRKERRAQYAEEHEKLLQESQMSSPALCTSCGGDLKSKVISAPALNKFVQTDFGEH